METEGESVLVPFFTKLVNHRTNNQGPVCFDSLLLLLMSLSVHGDCLLLGSSHSLFVILLVLHYVVFIIILCVCVCVSSVNQYFILCLSTAT